MFAITKGPNLNYLEQGDPLLQSHPLQGELLINKWSIVQNDKVTKQHWQKSLEQQSIEQKSLEKSY